MARDLLCHDRMNTSGLTTTLAALSFAALIGGCASDQSTSRDNPFTQDMSDDGKEDSAYLNPDGTEIEVDLEGDVAGSQFMLSEGPAQIGQFALTYFRKQDKMYIESLAEDATTTNRAEWQINGTWFTADKVPSGSTLKHWRLRGLNAVFLYAAGTKPKVGDQLIAKVPANPFSVFADASSSCADNDDHIELDQSVYWYRWEPKTGCTATLQDLKVTVSKTFSTSTASVYPEYDQLVKDNKVTFVVLFGEIDDGEITANETGMRNFAQFGSNLVGGGFKKVSGPLGQRYEKKLSNGVLAQIDLYSPKEFSGLGDFGHFANFQKALSEHEVVAYDGHSMLGASDFWARPTYPSFYQIFLYGGCLGYEYYVKPILHGKGDSWKKLDILSSVVEVTADANIFAAPAIAKIIYSIEHGKRTSWKSVLNVVRDSVGDSTFGVSGVRENCYAPGGNRC